MRYGNPQPEAPTHLGSHQLPLPPEWLPAEEFEDDDDGPTRARGGRDSYDDSIPTRQPTERSASPLLLDNRIERSHPDDVRRESKRISRGSSPTVEGKKKGAPETYEERQSFVTSGEVQNSANLDEKRRARSSGRGSSDARSSDANRDGRRSDSDARSSDANRDGRRSDSDRDPHRSGSDRDARRSDSDRDLRRSDSGRVARRSDSDRSDSDRVARRSDSDRVSRRSDSDRSDSDRDSRRLNANRSDSDRDARRSDSDRVARRSNSERSSSERSSSDRDALGHASREAKSSSAPFEARSQSAPSASSSEERPSARGSQPEIRVGSQPEIRVGSQPQIPVGAPPVMGAAGPGAQPLTIDPLAVPVPPELGGPIYSWIRRLALQADLQGADKLLREAFIDLTSSLSVAIVYPGAEGLWSLGEDGEIPTEATPIVAVAQARRAMIATHTALIPIVTSTETVAVVILTRNPRNPGYHPVEQVAAVALAREAAAILHHLAVAHLQRASEIKADQGGLYRGEALEAHRTRGNEGVPVNLSPSWIKRAYPLLVVTILIAVVASIFITVPTYSSGTGVVILQGTPVTAPAMGTVDQIYVKPGQQVKEGTPLVRLHSQQEDDELRNAQTEADNAITQYLHDASDEMVRKTMIAALSKVDLQKARVAARVVRARTTGTVSDVRVQLGALLQPGDAILQVVDPKAEPEMWAFLPGKDRPRLRQGQMLQIEILGYTKTREKVAITYVSPETFGAAEVAKIVGATLADSVKMPPGSYVWVKAKMPKTFKTQHSTLWYHHGMVAKTEVKIQVKPFLVTLLPSLEKYLPD